MGKIYRGKTFGVTEEVTNTKLHLLIDNATIDGIVNADIDAGAAISDTKLADITTADKVRGTAISDLPSIASGAGLIPYANIPQTSLTSIPNTDLLPITLASWVSGTSFRDLASTPTSIGEFPYQSIVSSLASGAVPRYSGGGGFVAHQLENYDYVEAGATYTEVSADTERTTLATSYTKMKEISPLIRSGVYRVEFDGYATHATDPNLYSYYKIYKNGIAEGTEQTETAVGYYTYNENITVSTGDVLQVYAYKVTGVGTTAKVRNFRLKCLNPSVLTEVSGY